MSMRLTKVIRTVGAIAMILLVGACADSDGAASARAQGSAGGAMAELAALDDRIPVPLQPMMAWHQKQNMMEHLVAIQRIVGGLAAEDWEEIATASEIIGLSPQMQTMCEKMGAGAVGFTDLALDFHLRANKIGDAARREDRQAVLDAASLTLQACTACHATFRQDVVDAATWRERTAAARESADGPR